MTQPGKNTPPPGFILVFDKPLRWRRKRPDGTYDERSFHKVCSVKRRQNGKTVIRYLTEFNVVIDIKDIDRRPYKIY